MKKILFALALALQLIATGAGAQTAKLQTLQVLGSSTFGGSSAFNAIMGISYVNPVFYINDSTGVNKAQMLFQDAGSTIWGIGSNTGGNNAFALDRYTGGTYVDSPISVNNSTGVASFAQRPLFGVNTPWDTGNLSPSSFIAASNNNTFTGTNSFTNNVTMSGTNSIAGYLSTATAATTYLPQSNPTATGTMTAGTFSGAGTSLTGTAAGLNIGGTAAKATSLAGGAANQIPFQASAGSTSYIAAPTTASTYLQWNGSGYSWAAAGGGGGGGSGTVTSVGLSGGTTGLTFSGSPVTTAGTITAAGTLGAANGGTGATTLTAKGLVIGQGTSAVTTTAAGAVGYSLVAGGTSVDPKWANTGIVLTGADPTGVADSTTAIQNFINLVVPNGYTGIIPAGNYKISAAINMPFGWGWKIEGRSMQGTTITQTANNTPIFKFATGVNGGGSPEDVGDYEWAINDMTLNWSTPQPIANNQSVGIFFTNSNETYFDFQVSRVSFTNAYRGIALDVNAAATVWGCSIRDIVYGSTNSGSAINFESAGAGQPNISIDGVYITATNIDASEHLIGVNNNDSSWYNHIEVNGDTNGNTILYLSGAGTIGTVKVEVATFTSGQFAFVFPNAHFTIGSLSFDTLTVAASGGAAYGIDANGGGGGSTLVIGQTNLTFASITGNFYLVNSGAAPQFSVRFQSAPQGLLNATGAYLTQVPAAVSADGVSIDDWQQPRLSADFGNTNANWTIGQPNRILYATTLTANRTVTFLDSFGNTSDTNLYNGFDVCVIRSAPTLSTFTLTVKNGGGTTIGTIPASMNGKLCFMWKRSVGAWVQIEKTTWNTTP